MFMCLCIWGSFHQILSKCILHSYSTKGVCNWTICRILRHKFSWHHTNIRNSVLIFFQSPLTNTSPPCNPTYMLSLLQVCAGMACCILWIWVVASLSESCLSLLFFGFLIPLCMRYLSFRETHARFLILHQTKHSQKTHKTLIVNQHCWSKNLICVTPLFEYV